MVRNLGKPKAPAPYKPGLPAKFEKAKSLLHDKLHSKIDFKITRKGAGTIIIEFKSAEDFDRILSKLDA